MLSKLTAAWLALALSSAAPEASLHALLAEMDAAAASFRAVKASLRKVSLTAVIQDETAESGTLWMARKGQGTAGVRMRIEFGEPDERSVAFEGRRAEIYYPKIRTVHVYDLGKQQKLVEQFLLLGFGTPGRQLAKDFAVQMAAEEQVAGEQAARLELVPKAAKTREQLAKVELWIALPKGHPVQQKFHWPSGDTTTITYTAIEINPPIGASDLALKLPPDVKREYPQR